MTIKSGQTYMNLTDVLFKQTFVVDLCIVVKSAHARGSAAPIRHVNGSGPLKLARMMGGDVTVTCEPARVRCSPCACRGAKRHKAAAQTCRRSNAMKLPRCLLSITAERISRFGPCDGPSPISASGSLGLRMNRVPTPLRRLQRACPARPRRRPRVQGESNRAWPMPAVVCWCSRAICRSFD